jgi:predicted flap endonuclease-1-like 5' DNA nuclease
MATASTAPFEELTKTASDFVTPQRGMWDHEAWMDFLSRVQHKGVDVSEDMQSKLGDLLEAMKDCHTAVSSTDDIEQAMSTVFNESVAFIKRQKGVWGRAEWEDFLKTMQQNTRTWPEGTEAYLGGVLESLKEFYALPPAAAVEKSPPAASKRSSPPSRPATARRQPQKRDELTAIAGLGPALAKKLNQEGIVSYAQLAELSDADIARLEKHVIKSTGRFKRNDWVGQAKKLAQG